MHDATLRLGEVSGWVKNAHAVSFDPALDLKKFVPQWQAWWKAINPKWRLRDDELVKEGVESWDEMRKPGQNGFLNILICLLWWREALGDADLADWTAAVEDVEWVLEGMLGYVARGHCC